MIVKSLYPWTQRQWHHLLDQYKINRLPHALLIHGPEGTGKFEFAKQVRDTLLCDHNHQANQNRKEIVSACGKCNSCQLIAAGTHPDSYVVEPEAEGKQIPVATIRDINQFLSLKSQFAPMQLVIIAPAEAMNRNSANALLKTLEEPQPDKLIILISSQPNRLLPTIRSRCQQINISLPTTEEGISWLQSQNIDQSSNPLLQRLLALAGGAPLLALRYAQQGKLEIYDQLLQSFEKLAKNQADPVKEAKRWENAGLAHSVKWLYLWVSSLIHLKSTEGMVDTNKVIWREPSLDFLIERTNSVSLYGFLDQLTEISRIVNTSVNVQLTLESLLMDWCQRLK